MVAVSVPIAVVVKFGGNTVYDDIARCVLVKPADDIQKRGFSAPGRTEYGNELAFSKAQIHAFQRLNRLIPRNVIFYYILLLKHII